MPHSTGDRYNLRFLVITVSDARSEATDESGKRMLGYLLSSGRIAARSLIPNSEKRIIEIVEENAGSTDIFVFIGGTGVGKRDLTSRTLRKISQKEVPGFGETFRFRSSQEKIHSILSDASMFVYNDKILFSIPGSSDAQELAFSLINDLVDHAYHEIIR